MSKYVIGVDFGTLSARAILVAADSGELLATSVMDYPHGVLQDCLPDGRTRLGRDWCLQVPSDYIETLCRVVPEAVARSGVRSEDVAAISMDCTASTLVPVDGDGRPLCELPEFANCPHAYVKLWKHHAAQPEAQEINDKLTRFPNRVADYYGPAISSEIVLPKVLQILREAPRVYERAAAILEIPDWIGRMLTGEKRQSINTAGYKAMYFNEHGYPDRAFLRAIDPALEGFVDEKLSGDVCPIDRPFGALRPAWAQRLGLRPGIAVGCGIIDAHACMIGCGITRPRRMMLVLGTSSVQSLLSERSYCGGGIIGAVRDCIVPGYYAWETGLAAVGDQLSWYAANCAGMERCDSQEELSRRLARLTEAAAAIAPGESRLVALPWWNGNKTPYLQSGFSGVVAGLRLDTSPAMLFRALMESTAYGSRDILERFEGAGERVDEIVACGGIAEKNPVMMQIFADALGREIRVAACSQTGAMGAAVIAATAAGLFGSLDEAASRMTGVLPGGYAPDAHSARIYDALYEQHRKLAAYFGGEGAELFERLSKLSRPADGKG